MLRKCYYAATCIYVVYKGEGRRKTLSIAWIIEQGFADLYDFSTRPVGNIRNVNF